MKELYVFCEGPTEQGFCMQALSPHLFPHHDGCIHTIKIAHSKHHGIVYRGGIGKYASLKRDIQNTLKSRHENNVFFTSMIDLYALPNEFPGKAANVRDPNNPTPYAIALETAFGVEIGDFRFIPHLQLHEYETMLLAEPDSFRISFDDCDQEIATLKALVASFPTIEHINDGKDTAPSKRIIDLLPAYDGLKTTAGPDIAEYTGIAAIRGKCPHFHEWLSKLEGLNWGCA
jgi:hypothetical protein